MDTTLGLSGERRVSTEQLLPFYPVMMKLDHVGYNSTSQTLMCV